MKTIGLFVSALILALMLHDGLNPPPAVNASSEAAISSEVKPPSPDPFETTAIVLEECTSPYGSKDYAGNFTYHTNEIRLCTLEIQSKASSLGVDPSALKRFILAHESAHSRGIRDETQADIDATDRLFAAGDYAAVAAYGAIPSDGSVYDTGRRYAQNKAQQVNNP